MKYFTGDNTKEINFSQFIQGLMPDPREPKEKMIKGCQVMFPNTVFLKGGNLHFMTKLDADMCMETDSRVKIQAGGGQSSTSTFLSVRKLIDDIVKARQEDCEQFGIQKIATERNKPKETNQYGMPDLTKNTSKTSQNANKK